MLPTIGYVGWAAPRRPRASGRAVATVGASVGAGCILDRVDGGSGVFMSGLAVASCLDRSEPVARSRKAAGSLVAVDRRAPSTLPDRGGRVRDRCVGAVLAASRGVARREPTDPSTARLRRGVIFCSTR